MTAREAIEAIKLDGLEIKGNLRRFNEFLEGLAMAEEALEKQNAVDKVINRLEDKKKECDKFIEINQIRALVDREVQQRLRELHHKSMGFYEAIEIIKELM